MRNDEAQPKTASDYEVRASFKGVVSANLLQNQGHSTVFSEPLPKPRPQLHFARLPGVRKCSLGGGWGLGAGG